MIFEGINSKASETDCNHLKIVPIYVKLPMTYLKEYLWPLTEREAKTEILIRLLL